MHTDLEAFSDAGSTNPFPVDHFDDDDEPERKLSHATPSRDEETCKEESINPEFEHLTGGYKIRRRHTCYCHKKDCCEHRINPCWCETDCRWQRKKKLGKYMIRKFSFEPEKEPKDKKAKKKADNVCSWFDRNAHKRKCKRAVKNGNGNYYF